MRETIIFKTKQTPYPKVHPILHTISHTRVSYSGVSTVFISHDDSYSIGCSSRDLCIINYHIISVLPIVIKIRQINTITRRIGNISILNSDTVNIRTIAFFNTTSPTIANVSVLYSQVSYSSTAFNVNTLRSSRVDRGIPHSYGGGGTSNHHSPLAVVYDKIIQGNAVSLGD